eukprot:g3712.t1
MSSNFFRGTTAEQDSRWGDAEKKLLRRTKFSKVLEQKVNMKRVNMDVMQRWIAQRITSLLGFEDDIVVGTCVNYLSEEGKLDPKKLQLQLTGFLEKSTGMFMEELWGLLVDAQSSLGGIPSAFLQDKKDEMAQAKEEELKKEEELQRRMAEHQEEMQKAAALTATSAATATPDSNLISAPGKPSRPGGRRASRWGVTAVAPMPPAEQMPATEVSRSAADTASAAPPIPIEENENGSAGDRSPSDRSRSRHEDDGDRRKEKRKSKKHRRKSDRKKHRRSSKTEPSSGPDQGSGDDGNSSDDDEEKPAEDVEEALRQTLLASKKERQAQALS